MGEHKDIRDFLETAAKTYGARTAFSVFQRERWQTITFADLLTESLAANQELRRAGLKPGQRAIILSEASIEWVTYFFGILLNGSVAVPLDTKLTETELRNITEHSEPHMILASSNMRDTSRQIRKDMKEVPKILILDDAPDSIIPVTPFSDMPPLSRTDLAAICYTSGTIGRPKGVRVKVETLLFESEAIAQVDTRNMADTVMFSMVPLNHLLGLTGGMIYTIICGYEMCFAHALEPEAIMKCLLERNATQLLTVPLFLKMVKQGVERRVREAGKEKQFKFFLKVCSVLPLGRFFFKQVHARLGGNLRRFVVGGSSLDPAIFDFFEAIGIPIYEGYGLTETGPVIAVNSEHGRKRGSVGKPLPGVEVRIDFEKENHGSGEILTRGPHVMEGYHKASGITDEVMTNDGWFRTGDIGHIDKGGFLFVTGRKKSLIVLSSGKKVHPEEVEACISQSQRIKDVCVVGLKDHSMIGETVVAVIYPTEETTKDFTGTTEEFEKSLRSEVQRLCQDLVDFKRPSKIIIRDKPFVMTSTQKVKRDALLNEIS